MRQSPVHQVDARMQPIAGMSPPAAEVVVELDGYIATLTPGTGRVLLEALARSVTAAERYADGEEARLLLQRRQAARVAQLRGRR